MKDVAGVFQPGLHMVTGQNGTKLRRILDVTFRTRGST